MVDCIYLGVTVLNFKRCCIFLSEYHFTVTNSIGSGEMQRAAFHLGLHCLQKDPFSIQRVYYRSSKTYLSHK